MWCDAGFYVSALDLDIYVGPRVGVVSGSLQRYVGSLHLHQLPSHVLRGNSQLQHSQCRHRRFFHLLTINYKYF